MENNKHTGSDFETVLEPGNSPIGVLAEYVAPITPAFGLPVGWVDLLDISMHQKSEAQSKAPTNRNPLRPSSAGKCGRAKAYEYAEYKGKATYEKEVLSPETQRIFSLGHAVERDILYHFKGVEHLQVRYQQQVLTFQVLPDGEVQEGSIDAVFYHPKARCIIDIKSKKEKHSNSHSSDWDEMTERLTRMESVQAITDQTFWAEDLAAFLEELDDPFFAQNFLQLNLYACHEFLTERGVDTAAIIQVSKNTSRIREIRFKPSKELYDYILQKDYNISKIIIEGGSPTEIPKDFTLGNIACAWCSHRKTCWPQNDATKDYYRGLPDKKFWPKDTNRMQEAVGAEFETLLSELQETETHANRAEVLKQKVLHLMETHSIYKVKLENGDIYESKRLKNSIELRRGKL